MPAREKAQRRAQSSRSLVVQPFAQGAAGHVGGLLDWKIHMHHDRYRDGHRRATAVGRFRARPRNCRLQDRPDLIDNDPMLEYVAPLAQQMHGESGLSVHSEMTTAIVEALKSTDF